MKDLGYDSQLIIANNSFSQSQWLMENNMQLLTERLSLEQLYELAKDIPQITNEIHKPNDYYGHATILKRYAQCMPEYQIKGTVEHGIYLGNYTWDVELNAPLPAIIAFSNYRCRLLKEKTSKALFAVGPFLRYAPHFLNRQVLESEKKRLRKNLLVFPPHSTHWVYEHYDIHGFCRKLESIGKEFDNIRICLYWKDILRGQAEEYMQHGFECVTAGHIYDPLFLPRLKSIIESATIAMSSEVGTQLGYCVFMNKPVFTFQIDVKTTVENKSISLFRGDVVSPRVRKQINAAFREMRDDISPQQRELIEKYWGSNEYKTPEQMRLIFQIIEDMHKKGPGFFINNANLIQHQVKDYLDSNKNERASFLIEQSSVVTANVSLSGKAKAANSDIKASEVLALMQKALDSLNANQNDIAFNFLNEAKSLKPLVEGLDFLRAIYFMRKNKPAEAREALKEELRYFPNSENAIDLLARINAQCFQSASSTKSKTGHTKLNMLNLGRGNRYHPDWTNIDFQSSGTDVIAFDLNKPLPFEDESFDVVYHSHLLEHFPQSRAPVFTGECFRILKPGGIIRVVVPDLEQIARWYLKMFEKSMQGVKDAQERYEWIMLELFDQMVRNVSGGEMLNYWKQDTIPAEDFVIERVGSEVKNVLNKIRQNAGAATATMPQTYNKNIALDPYQIGRFRLSGEIHQWMYDRYSLGKLLKQAGFREVRVCRADESMIANFNSYLLDIEPDGSVRKPDSLFMEGRR